MSKLPLIILAILIPSLINGQNIDSIIFESKEMSIWQNESKFSYTYNVDGGWLTCSNQFWDTDSFDWLDAFHGVNTFNSNGTIDFTVFKKWNGTGWDNFDKTIYHYTSTGKVDTVTIQEYGIGEWINDFRTINQYDINDYKTYSLEQISLGDWNNSKQNFITNNEEGLPIEFIQESWNTISNDWEKNYKESYTYNNPGLITEVFREDWIDSAWVNDRKITTVYDVNDLITLIQRFNWDLQTTSWVVEEKWVYTYNSDYTESQYVRSVKDALTGLFEEVRRRTYYYSAPLDLFEEQNSSVGLYPNPAKNLVNIDLNTTSSTSLSLADLSGRVLQTIELEEGLEAYQLDVSNYPLGMYFIEIHQEGKLLRSEKVIIE